MRTTDILRIAMSTFFNNRMRTLLTILGVSIGIATIVFLVSIGYGLQQITIGEIKSIKALTTYNVTTGNSSILALDNEAIEELKEIENVSSVSPLLSMSGQISIDDKKTDVLVNAASSEYVDLESPKMTAGDIYKDDAEDSILVTEVMANAFNIKHEDMVDKMVSLSFYVPNPTDVNNPTLVEKSVKVVGVVRDTSASYIYLPLKSFEVPLGLNYNAVKVNVDEPKNMSKVKEVLSEMGYRATSIGERIAEMNKIFNIGQVILLIFGAIALIVASIGMFNTLTISLLERTKDIGIMKALGATDRSIYAIFLAESTIISFAGGIVGISLSMVIGVLVNLFVSTLATKAGSEAVAIFQPPWLFVGVIFVFSIIVGVLTGLYPSRRAANIDPLDALRYE